jgi:hypothetical protein
MRGKYITKQVLLACLSKPQGVKKDIHTLLGETIAERKRILEQREKSFLGVSLSVKKDIHALLEETIAERKRILQQWEKLFFPKQDNSYLMEDKRAA